MGLVDILFKKSIEKRVQSQIAERFGNNIDDAIGIINAKDIGLPTINPDKADYYEISKSVGAVYETTDLISKKVIGSPIVFYKVVDKKKLREAKKVQQSNPIQHFVLKSLSTEEVFDERLMDLFKNPNPYQTGTQFMWGVCLSYLLYGNAYIYANRVDGKAKELYCFPEMEIVADGNNLLDPIVGYRLRDGDLTEFSKDEIYHIKTGNAAFINGCLDYLYGVSPLRAYLESIRSIREGNLQGSKQVKSGGSLGLISAANKEDNLSDKQLVQFHERLTRAVRSNEDLARILVGTIQMSYQKIGLSPADLQLIELINAKEEDIYRAYHVPLSYHNQKASTDNNVGTEVQKLMYDAVKPICDVLGESFTRFLSKEFSGVIIDFDFTQLPEMAINMKEVSDYVRPLTESGILSLDEARLALRHGETNRPEMKAHYMKSNMVTVNSVYEGKSINTNNNSNENSNTNS